MIEGIVPFYHKTSPEYAKKLERGERIAPGGLSVFIDPEQATAYNFSTSRGTVPEDAVTVSGKISHRRLLPDIEWNPETYKKMFIRIAQNIQNDPNYRVPSITQTANTSRGVSSFVTPGITTEVDPATGKKRLTRNWEPEFKVVGDKLQIPKPFKISDFPVEFQDAGKPVEKVDIDDPRVKPVVTSKSRVYPDGKSNRPDFTQWGGRGTSGEDTYVDPFSGKIKKGIFGFKELRDLDVMSNKGELKQITVDAMKAERKAKQEANEKNVQPQFFGYRMKGGSPLPDTTVSKGSNATKQLGAAGLAAAGAIAGSALTTGVQATTDVLGMVGALPAPKDRMQIEKQYHSDIGLEFDLSPEGELEMNPAGREAARKRQNRGINFPSMFRK